MRDHVKPNQKSNSLHSNDYLKRHRFLMDQFQAVGSLRATLLLCIMIRDTDYAISLLKQSPSLFKEFAEITSDE